MISLSRARQIVGIEDELNKFHAGAYLAEDAAVLKNRMLYLIKLQDRITTELKVLTWSHALERARGYLDRMKHEPQQRACLHTFFLEVSNQN